MPQCDVVSGHRKVNCSKSTKRIMKNHSCNIEAKFMALLCFAVARFMI